MKRRYLLKSTALVVTVAMLIMVFFTACGDKKDDSTTTGTLETTTQSTEPAKQDETTVSEAKGLKGDFEVQIFVGGYGDAWWKEMLDGFQKENPELNIIRNMGPKVNEQMKTRWLSDNPPDFVYCDGAEGVSTPFALDGKLMDLKDFFDSTKAPDGKSIREHMIPGVITQINGGEYFAPYIFSAMALFYDEKLLKDNGIAEPQDFEEFLEVGEKLKEKGIALLNYPGIYPVYLYQGFVEPALVAEGGLKLLEDVMTGKAGVYTSQPFKNVISKVATLAEKGYIQKGISRSSLTPPTISDCKIIRTITE
ncbi:MAG TPA: extracellular solute-binding protein [Clostridiaceae bacterium]|nr:extracellular solute-binding protein [Clostridiaceae bacterium]